jgi:hypothetical protein
MRPYTAALMRNSRSAIERSAALYREPARACEETWRIIAESRKLLGLPASPDIARAEPRLGLLSERLRSGE